MPDSKKPNAGGASSSASASASANQGQQQQQGQQQGQGQDGAGAGAVPGYGVLDEDDEFDDFPVQDWPDSDTVQHATRSAAAASAPTSTSGAGLSMTGGSLSSSSAGAGAGAGAGGAGAGAGDHLWEDNWDDDDVEDEFSKALRAEVEKQMGGSAAQA